MRASLVKAGPHRQCFESRCFHRELGGTFGNTGWSSVIGLGYFNLDGTLSRWLRSTKLNSAAAFPGRASPENWTPVTSNAALQATVPATRRTLIRTRWRVNQCMSFIDYAWRFARAPSCKSVRGSGKTWRTGGGAPINVHGTLEQKIATRAGGRNSPFHTGADTADS